MDRHPVDLISARARSCAPWRKSMPAPTPKKVAEEFVKASTKVMNADRFDLA